MKICCVGIAILDRIFKVDSLPTGDGKFFAKSFHELGGGPAANAAVAITRLGGEVDMIARVGDDATGKIIIEGLDKEKVNTNNMAIIKGAQSTQASIIVDANGNRMIVSYPSPSLVCDAKAFFDKIDFSQYDAVLCDVRWYEGAKIALTLAKEHNIPSVLDADTTTDNIDELIKLCSYAVFSKPGIKQYSKKDDIDEALKFTKNNTKAQVFVTLGEDGYKYFDKDNIIHTNSFKVDVVDTTGAGDVFHGAFAYAICKQYDTQKVLKFASAVAALKCTKVGGRAGIPNLEQVLNFIDNN